jgi:DNA-binding Xre family transcriptional regulator
MEGIISRINERISEKGITRRELSRQTGITEQMLYLITVKHQNVSLFTLAKIRDALELKIEITKTME